MLYSLIFCMFLALDDAPKDLSPPIKIDVCHKINRDNDQMLVLVRSREPQEEVTLIDLNGKMLSENYHYFVEFDKGRKETVITITGAKYKAGDTLILSVYLKPIFPNVKRDCGRFSIKLPDR